MSASGISNGGSNTMAVLSSRLPNDHYVLVDLPNAVPPFFNIILKTDYVIKKVYFSSPEERQNHIKRSLPHCKHVDLETILKAPTN